MPAYVVAEVEILNPEGYKAYGQAVPATIEKYGGRLAELLGVVATSTRSNGTPSGGFSIDRCSVPFSSCHL